MSAKLEKTRTPGVYRRGSRYVVPYRANGRQHWETVSTEAQARRLKAARTTDIERGEFQAASKVTLHAYALEWVHRYQGRGRRGFREETRNEYRRLLTMHILPEIPERQRITDITPLQVAQIVGRLCEQIESDRTVRNILTPFRACLATAVREGLIRSNPAREIDLPARANVQIDDDDGPVKAMTRSELSTLLAIIPARSRLPFQVLASTGLRISELRALEWRHVQLDGSKPCVRIRQAYVRGRLGPPKSQHGRRDVPIPHSLVIALREHRAGATDGEPVFAGRGGARLDADHLRSQVLAPAAEEAGIPWVGFHAFRHTCASMLFADGRNAVQVQRWLGHHSPAFTLATYVHLLDSGVGDALEILPSGGEGPDGTVSTGSLPEALTYGGVG